MKIKITALLLCFAQITHGESIDGKSLWDMGNDLRTKCAKGELKKRDDGFYLPVSGDYSFGFDSGNGAVGVVWECSPEKGLEKFNALCKQRTKCQKSMKEYSGALPKGYIESQELLAEGSVEYYADIYEEKTSAGYFHSLSLYMHGDKAWVELVFFNSINDGVEHPGQLNRRFREEKRVAELAAEEQSAKEQSAINAKQRAINEEKRVAKINELVKKISSAKQWKGPRLYFEDTTGLRLAYALLNEGKPVKEKTGEVITLTEADPNQVWWKVLQVGNNFVLIKPESREPIYEYNAENQKLFREGIFMIQAPPETIKQLLEGQRITGYYFLAGIQRYKTVLGVEKPVPCLLRVEVPE